MASSTVFFSSCKKYDEGPSLSLRSKKARVANHWKYKSAKNGGVDYTSLFANFTIELTKDGKFTTYNSSTVLSKGTWEFNDKKEAIVTKTEGTNDTETLTIKLLKDKEMILETTENNSVSRYEMEPK